MPNNKILKEKQEIVSALSEKLKTSVSGVFVDYKGINVEDDTKLRKELREAGVDYKVVKNTLTRLAVREVGLEAVEPILEGTTALAVHPTDAVAPAKILAKFAKDNENFKIKAGFVEGKVLSIDEIKELANLPSKEILVAKVLGSLNSPIAGFVNVLNGNIRGLVIALNAIAEKKN